MRWVWTDELAKELADEQPSEWIDRPVAYAVADDADLQEVARRLREASA